MREVPLYPVGGARAGRGLMKMVWCLEQGQTLQPAAAQPQGEDKVTNHAPRQRTSYGPCNLPEITLKTARSAPPLKVISGILQCR